MKKIAITADTPLSALIRDNHHQELSLYLEQWRRYLKGVNSDTDLFRLSYFEFDLDRLNVGVIYHSLALLINHDAVMTNVSVLAGYVVEHSNMGIKKESVYRQINRYL